ncbi:hypothetical protein F5883DRAFT_424333, partial [Diaporthe sp. PMI_573]
RAAYLIPHLMPHFDILDVGSRPGSIAKDLAAICSHGQTLGLNISPELAAKLSCAVKNKEDLSQLLNNSFNVIYSHIALFHLHNPNQTFKEFICVYKPRGIMST